jgi:hypothetical protein
VQDTTRLAYPCLIGLLAVSQPGDVGVETYERCRAISTYLSAPVM